MIRADQHQIAGIKRADVVARDDIRTLYAGDLVLVRPDHHVAWRGDRIPDDPDALIARVVGAALPSLASAAKAG